MAYKPKDIYRGKLRLRPFIMIPLAILLFLLLIFLSLFYGLQKYIVYGQDGVYLDFNSEIESPIGPGGLVPGVVAEIVYDDPDYSDLDISAGKELEPVKALYLSSSAVTLETLGDIRTQLDARGANALVLEMKNPQGVLSWNSGIQIATSYGTDGNTDLSESLSFLKEQGVYLVARISVCVDEYMALRNSPLALATSEGRVFSDTSGIWIDPSNSGVRSYTAQIATELIDLGFDEIMLTNFSHPQLTGDTTLGYAQVTSVTLTPKIIMSGFALAMRDVVDDKGARLSILCDANSFRNNLDEQTGQDPTLFGKIFDRYYWSTDGNALPSDMEIVAQSIPRSELATRFVPIMFATGTTESWMYPYA